VRISAFLVALALAASGCGPSEPPPRAAAGTTPPPATSAPPTVSPTPTRKPPPPPSPTVAPTTAAPRPVVTTSRPAAPPPPPVTTNRRCDTPPAASTGGYGRTITPAAPLDLLITGDSLQESMGPQLTGYANATKRTVAGCTVPKYSTGLVRDDFFDWPAYAKELSASRDPEAVSFMIGGNDAQNMSVGGRILEAGSAEWAAEYQRRAAAVMSAFARPSRRVYWIGMPIARSERHTRVFQVANAAVKKAAAGVAGVQYVDIWAMFAPHGVYQDSFADEYGRVQRMRSSDGIHLSTAGAGYLARRMLKTLNADWHLTA
jgi:hypothetical protein